jgi:hypothetical protein
MLIVKFIKKMYTREPNEKYNVHVNNRRRLILFYVFSLKK